MRPRSRSAPFAVLALLSITSCDSPTVIRGSELETYVAAVLIEGVRGVLQPTAAPEAGGGPSATTPASLNGITGGSSQLELSGSGQFRQVSVSVPGVDGHYVVQLPFDVTSTSAIITIGGRAPVLDFDVVFAVAQGDGVWGTGQVTSLSAIEAAGGDIQVSVTWNTVADVDLHVVEPNGTEIYYGNSSSGSGGLLDIDANAACGTSSLRQENIGWDPLTAPQGQYKVRVDYWSSCGAVQTEYIVTVYLRSAVPAVPGSPGTGVLLFTGSFTGDGTGGGAGDGVQITTFNF